KKGIQFIAESEGGKIIEGQYIPKGMVYFGTDKGERKSTGSYYTPEYIVDYIVSNTVGEKLKELTTEFEKENNQLITDINTAFDVEEKESLNNLLEEQLLNFVKEKILKLSILDPAMGSGHFLVNATNQVANQITTFINSFNLQSNQISSTIYWRRRVVENCIYGVDLNPLAVELAKLSLWILSMAKDSHLSFLNHHLKCGNSLIGTKISDIGIYPGYVRNRKSKKEITLFEQDPNFKKAVETVIDDYLAIEERETITKDDIDFKKELLYEIDEALKPYKNVCDFHTSVYFNNNIDESEYFKRIKNFNQVQAEPNNYFNWELEYPEILITGDSFDCILGNPPWGVDFSFDEKDFLMEKHDEVHERTPDSFNYFMHLFYNYLNESSYLGYIIPSVFLFQSEYSTARKYYLTKKAYKSIINCGDNVFDVIAPCCIIIFHPNFSEKFNYLDLRDITRENKALAL
ncbi:MAG: N-6 DNA methylase, partial [Ignavibacteriae bacterium]|nr:N-6 DNA methylase [Ignavibacteriota bacterium]